jgi:LysM repeat protein
MITQPVFIITNSSNIDTTEAKGAINISENEPLKIKEEAIYKVYEVSKPVTNDDNITNFHKVLKGETLYILSQRYSTSLSVLKKANNLETTLIRVGQILRIKNFDTYSYGPISNNWTVSKGDTLYNIAHRNNTTVAYLKSLNGLTGNLIRIGQTLKLK